MRRHPRKRQIVAEINITPFTDVILVLLVIFMVATPLIYQSNIKVKLPESTAAQPREIGKIKQTIVTITNEGMVYLDDVLVTNQELREKIEAMQKENRDLSVYLRSDQQTRFKDVVDVLDIMTALGVSKLDIAAVQIE
jgi:biopolymer transport protein TolR